MSAIAGFNCDIGIVLGTDSQETSARMKFPREKLVPYDQEWCKAGFAGSCDHGDLVDGLIRKIVRAFDREKPETYEKIERIVHKAVLDFNDNEVKRFPAPDHEKIVDLLIALKPKQESLQLWSVHATSISEIQTYDVRGAGEVMRFVAERLYRDNMPLRRGRLLCTHLLGLAKTNLDGVGGESHILEITSDGCWLHTERVVETELVEWFFKEFDKNLGEVFLSFADTSLTETEFNAELQRLVTAIKALRADYVKSFQNLHLGNALRDPTGDPYVKLPHEAHERFGRKKVIYRQTGTSGVPSVSVSPSSSPSASPSPSPSASPEVPEDEDSQGTDG